MAGWGGLPGYHLGIAQDLLKVVLVWKQERIKIHLDVVFHCSVDCN